MTLFNERISQYVNELFVPHDKALQHTLEDSAHQGLPQISIRPEEGRFLQVLVRACGALKAVEIGTLGGYSGIWIARGLAPGGKLITLEKEPRHAEAARAHFAAAGVAERVEIRVGDAHALLQPLKAEGPFDFVFIDAEKPGYVDYVDWALENLRIGGIVAAHNAFRKGSVVGLGQGDEYTATMQAFNRRVAADPRLFSTIYPAGDGTVIAVKIA